jgi:flavin reductase (DIM6/NTAB) family NADH-FMN oxidoreductase RutF
MKADLNKSDAGNAVHTGISAHDFRAALGLFATGVTIVTTRAPDGAPVGLTVNSFNSVSRAPPLVLWSLGLQAGSRPVFEASPHYAIHVLAAPQRDLAQKFASRVAQRFDGVAWQPGLGGVPLIEGCAAVFECRSLRHHTEGDHLLLIGEVQRCSAAPAGTAPLIFHGGRFYTELPL